MLKTQTHTRTTRILLGLLTNPNPKVLHNQMHMLLESDSVESNAILGPEEILAQGCYPVVFCMEGSCTATRLILFTAIIEIDHDDFCYFLQ